MIANKRYSSQQVAPHAFAERRSLQPIWGGAPVAAEEWQTLFRQEIVRPLEQDALAYIHIPFCANHCVFCGFYRNPWHDEQSAIYVDKVIGELAQEAQMRSGSGKIRAVYFGGGTPTALHTADLVRLIEACQRYLPLAEDCEFTLEGRIRHFDLDKARACIAAGVNRISIGVQTFNTEIRRKLGRKFSGDEAYQYLEQLAREKVVLVADLMFGLPRQDDAVWAQDIARACALPLAGLDTYAFNLFPQLPINRMIENDKFPAPPSLAEQSCHYAYAVETLMENGWLQVSNSHFARPDGGERNLYNTLVKSNMPCLAFGSGAGGNIGAYSYMVQADLQQYLDTPSGEKNILFMSRHGEHKALLAQVQHDIELGQIDSTLFKQHPHALRQIQAWAKQDLLSIDQNGLAHLHTSGRFWSPTMTRKLMMSLSSPSEQGNMMTLNDEERAQLRDSLAKRPGQILEMLANEYQCSLADVLELLPEGMARKIGSEHFVAIMGAIAEWEHPITFITHTPDVIMEVSSRLPKGRIARGFYNFEEGEAGGVHGHIYHEHCATIYLLERPFMGTATMSLNFINHKGGAMFKIFVGRDENGKLREEQITAMRELFNRLEA